MTEGAPDAAGVRAPRGTLDEVREWPRLLAGFLEQRGEGAMGEL